MPACFHEMIKALDKSGILETYNDLHNMFS